MDLFHEHGIEFPFPQRNLTLRNPEAVVEAFLDRSEATRETFRVVEEPKRKSTQHLTDPTYADAILDRLVHNAHRIDLVGDGLRRTRPRSAARD